MHSGKMFITSEINSPISERSRFSYNTINAVVSNLMSIVHV